MVGVGEGGLSGTNLVDVFTKVDLQNIKLWV